MHQTTRRDFLTTSASVLAAPTLKHLRERWWDEAFTAFVKETVQPRAGRRILDVGCGTGTAEVQLSRLHLSQVWFVAVDLMAIPSARSPRRRRPQPGSLSFPSPR